jgi:hypothetical protein
MALLANSRTDTQLLSLQRLPGEKTLGEEWRSIRKEVTAVVNIVITSGAIGYAVWWVSNGRLRLEIVSVFNIRRLSFLM